MTPQSKKSEEKRLRSCVLGPYQWAKIDEKLGQHARKTLKIGHFVADTAVNLENTHENG